MQYFLTSAALVASALAAPANIMSREAFELKQEEHGKFYKNGPLQLLSTYEKYASAGAVAPAEVKAAAAAQQSGSVSANPEQYDAAYLCPVTVGSSRLNLDFDTGSADLWVFSNETPASESTGHAKYNTASGRKIQGASWDITYGDQSGASGNVFADKVTVGSVTATSQAVEAATSVSSSFTQNVDSDGLLGLAFSSINTVKPQQQTTFFDTVRPTLQKALFTVDLRAGEAGSYTFGYIDSSKHSGSIAYVPVDNSQGFWQFTAGAYRVGGSSAASPSPSAGNGTAGGNETIKAAAASGSVGTAIADTGTSLLYLPTAVVQNYYAAVRGATYNRQQAGYTFPCSAALPNFAVEIGGQTFTIPGQYIKFAPLTDGSTTCFGGIQPDTGIGFSIFGDVFLKAVYAIFDVSQGSPRLGFAPKA